MKISIDRLQSQGVLSEINPSERNGIVGGASIDAGVSIFTSLGSSSASSGARVFASGPGVSGTFTATAEVKEENGSTSSRSGSYSFSSSN